MTPDLSSGFVYTAAPARVVFGAGRLADLAQELERLGASRALVLSTPAQRSLAEQAASLLGPAAAGVFDGAAMHVPIESARAAREVARRLGADCAVAVGGGSTIGLGKAIALESGLPIVAVPTTYAGSEMTPIYGITEAGLKKTGRDARVLPRTVLYDPDLTLGLPRAQSVTSGLNAIAHAAEGLYAADGHPISRLMAKMAIAQMGRALPAIDSIAESLPGQQAAARRAARADALCAAWLCGTVLGAVGMGLHHKLCHTLGGSFELPHAETHAVVLPHALAYNAGAAPQAMRDIAEALDAPPGVSAAQALFDLARDNGAPTALRDLGLRADALPRVLDLALETPYPNPRPLEREAMATLLRHAFDGTRPD